MPTVAFVEGAMIAFFHNDHGPAHCHASCGDLAMKVRIRDLVVIDGSLAPSKRRAVLAWAASHQDALALVQRFRNSHPFAVPLSEFRNHKLH